MTGYFYHPITNTTYYMRNGTCLMSWVGAYYIPDASGGWIHPEIVERCPVSKY